MNTQPSEDKGVSSESVRRLYQDVAGGVWRGCRPAFVRDGQIEGYPSFSMADLYEIAVALYAHLLPSPVESSGLGSLQAEERPCVPGETEAASVVGDEEIKRMVGRFLSWRLPEAFNPDAGISFEPNYNQHTAYPMKNQPTGTNLFSREQAEAMIRHMLEGLAK